MNNNVYKFIYCRWLVEDERIFALYTVFLILFFSFYFLFFCDIYVYIYIVIAMEIWLK